MFIGEISKTINREVVFGYLDSEGEYKESKFKISIKRLTFREAAGKSFREQMTAIETDYEKLAEVTAPLIADWELFADKDCTTKCPTTAEFLKDQDPALVGAIAECVFSALTTDPKQKPANSDNGSVQTAKPEIQTATP